jgi:hypothetical protein
MAPVPHDVVDLLFGLDWPSLYHSNALLFDGALYFLLFLSIAWVSLRRRFPGRPGRLLVIVLAVFLTSGMLYVEGRYGFSLLIFGPGAVLVVSVTLILLFLGLVTGLRRIMPVGPSLFSGNVPAVQNSSDHVLSEFTTLKDRVSALVKRSEESETSVLQALERLRKDFAKAPNTASVKRTVLRRLAALMRLQSGLDRRLNGLKAFHEALEGQDIDAFAKWKKASQGLTDRQKALLKRTLRRQWKRVLAEDKVVRLARNLKACGGRLEALLRGAADRLRQNERGELEKVLGEAASEAKTVCTLYRSVLALEAYLARQTKKLLKEIRRR